LKRAFTSAASAATHSTALLVLLLLTACGSAPTLIRQTLDPLTSVTVTSSATPFVFYRDNPARAAYARNYLHLGPIEVNRSGSYSYYLWIGVWSTMQTPDAIEQRDTLESVILFADGEPLSLELAGWSAEAIGGSEHIYVRPVADAIDAYYRVTADQIRLLAAATDLRLRTTGPAPRDYEPWDEQRAARRSLDAFLEKALF